MIEYEYLIRKHDRVSESWEFKDKIYRDYSFLEIVKYVGTWGWELVLKDSQDVYILKRG